MVTSIEEVNNRTRGGKTRSNTSQNYISFSAFQLYAYYKSYCDLVLFIVGGYYDGHWKDNPMFVKDLGQD